MVKRVEISSFLTPYPHYPQNKKQKVLYLRTDTSSDDKLIILNNFPKASTLQRAIESVEQHLLNHTTRYAHETDNHVFQEIPLDTHLSAIPSGTVIIPVFKLRIFKTKFLCPISFTGRMLLKYIIHRFDLRSNLSVLELDKKLINMNESLYKQNIADNAYITFLSSDKDDTLEAPESLEAEINCEDQMNEDTFFEFTYISLDSKNTTIQISSRTTFAQLIKLDKLRESLKDYLGSKGFTTIKPSHFRLCYGSSTGSWTTIPNTSDSVENIPSPKILIWMYHHDKEIFQNHLDFYISENSHDSLSFISETLCVVNCPEVNVFAPIYHLFHCQLTDEDDEVFMLKVRQLINFLKSKAKMFMPPLNYESLCSHLNKHYEKSAFVPSDNSIE